MISSPMRQRWPCAWKLCQRAEVEVEDVPADSLAGSPDDGRGVADEGAPLNAYDSSPPRGFGDRVRLGAGVGPGHRPTGTDDHLVEDEDAAAPGVEDRHRLGRRAAAVT